MAIADPSAPSSWPETRLRRSYPFAAARSARSGGRRCSRQKQAHPELASPFGQARRRLGRRSRTGEHSSTALVCSSSLAFSIARLNRTGLEMRWNTFTPTSEPVMISTVPYLSSRPTNDCFSSTSLTFSSAESRTSLLKMPLISMTRRLVMIYRSFTQSRMPRTSSNSGMRATSAATIQISFSEGLSIRVRATARINTAARTGHHIRLRSCSASAPVRPLLRLLPPAFDDRVDRQNQADQRNDADFRAGVVVLRGDQHGRRHEYQEGKQPTDDPLQQHDSVLVRAVDHLFIVAQDLFNVAHIAPSLLHVQNLFYHNFG